MGDKGAEPVYKFNVTKGYTYNPEKVEEGYRLLDEYLVEIFLEKQKRNQQERRES